MPYYDAILTSNFTMDIPGSFEIETGIMVHIEVIEGQYYLVGYYTNGIFVATSPQSIEANILEDITPSAGVVPEPQGPSVPVPEPEGLYRFRNIHLRL
jgi:hypothetical protein